MYLKPKHKHYDYECYECLDCAAHTLCSWYVFLYLKKEKASGPRNSFIKS